MGRIEARHMLKERPKIGKAVGITAERGWQDLGDAAGFVVENWRSSGIGSSGTVQVCLAGKGSPTKAEMEAMA